MENEENVPNAQEIIELTQKLIQEEQTAAWNQLCEEKFTGNNEQELTIMRNLWSHGFAKGVESALTVNQKVFEQQLKKS